MKIEAVFQKLLRISETKSAFWGQKTTVLNCYGQTNSNKNISNLFKTNIMKIMYEHMLQSPYFLNPILFSASRAKKDVCYSYLLYF